MYSGPNLKFSSLEDHRLPQLSERHSAVQPDSNINGLCNGIFPIQDPETTSVLYLLPSIVMFYPNVLDVVILQCKVPQVELGNVA